MFLPLDLEIIVADGGSKPCVTRKTVSPEMNRHIFGNITDEYMSVFFFHFDDFMSIMYILELIFHFCTWRCSHPSLVPSSSVIWAEVGRLKRLFGCDDTKGCGNWSTNRCAMSRSGPCFSGRFKSGLRKRLLSTSQPFNRLKYIISSVWFNLHFGASGDARDVRDVLPIPAFALMLVLWTCLRRLEFIEVELIKQQLLLNKLFGIV